MASVSPTEEEDERSDKSVQNLEKQLEALRFSKNGSEWLATEKMKELKSLEKPVRGIPYRASHSLVGKPETAEELRVAIIKVIKYSMDLRKENRDFDNVKL